PAPDSRGAKGRLYPPVPGRDKNQDGFPSRAARIDRRGSSAPTADLLWGRPVLDHLVYQPEATAFLARQIGIALKFTLNCFDRVSGVPDVDFVQSVAQRENFTRLDLDVGRLALGATRRLVYHDPRVR